MIYDAEKLGRPPMRKTRPEPEYTWDDNWKGEHLIRVNPCPHGGGSYAIRKPANKNPNRAQQIMERRQKVAALHNQGMTQVAIANEIGVSQMTVRHDLKSMKS